MLSKEQSENLYALINDLLKKVDIYRSAPNLATQKNEEAATQNLNNFIKSITEKAE